MKQRKFLFLVLVVLVGFLFASCNNEKYHNDQAEYFYQINNLIKDRDFHIAKVDKNKLELYNNKFELIDEITFEAYDDKIGFIAARKDGANIYFIISGSVDDEAGILFVNDESDSFLDGVKSIDRLGGNSYYYSTN